MADRIPADRFILFGAMETTILQMYLVAGVLSSALVGILVIFVRLHRRAVATPHAAAAMGVLALAFVISGIGPLLPRAATVVFSNTAFLISIPLFHGGLVAFLGRGRSRPDWPGIGLALLPVPLFAYWGLLEPDGHARSIVFSAAAGLLGLRSGRLLWRHLRGSGEHRTVGLWLLLAAIGLMVLSMAGRIGMLLLADSPIGDRGANPTTWLTVAWYILLIAAMAAGMMWIESNRRGEPTAAEADRQPPVRPIDKRVLIGLTATVLTMAILGELAVAYARFTQVERERSLAAARLANRAVVRQVERVLREADTLLRAVRGFHADRQSPAETERFIRGLAIDQWFIEDIFVIDAGGFIRVPQAAAAKLRSAAGRDYFKFHLGQTSDQPFITQVSKGLVTGKQQFRISRRMDDARGGLGGVVLIPIEPAWLREAISRFSGGAGDVTALIGTEDRRLRLQVPGSSAQAWDQAVESPLWDALRRSDSGFYRDSDRADGIERTHVYERVPGFSLVVVTGFSDAAVSDAVAGQMLVVVAGGVFAVGMILALLSLLVVVLRRRDEQDRFMSMLNHELKTPLAVIRMSLGDAAIDDAPRERVRRAVGEINEIIERCLLSDRLEGRAIDRRAETCRLDELLAAVVAERDAGEGIVCRMVETPPLVTDAGLARAILANLLDNALKYRDRDTPVHVGLARVPRRDRDGVAVAFANRPGPAGMPDPGLVFRKFYRAAGARRRTGSGLGLYIAHALARQLGGELRYCPEGGEVRFELWLPVCAE